MKLKSFAVLSLVLVACEGEPPKTPPTPPGPPPVAAVTGEEPAAEGAGEAPAAVAAAHPGALPPCACNCGCTGGAPPAGDAGASDGAAAVAVAAAPAAPVLGTISGNLTTSPKAAAAAAVVYLEDAPVEPTAKMTVTVTNKMMAYIPYVSVVPVGGKVVFRNDDPFPHNVFSPDNEKFNMGMIPQRAAGVRQFKSAGAYSLLCNVHPGMLGYLVVTPSSYFAKADAQGHFVIKNVPPGTYKVTAWAPREQAVTQPVTVKDSGDVPINFDLHR